MAIEMIYESRELQDGELEEIERHFSTDQEGVKEIIPEDDKVALHLEGETLFIPWNRIFELSIDLDPETVQELEQGKGGN